MMECKLLFFSVWVVITSSFRDGYRWTNFVKYNSNSFPGNVILRNEKNSDDESTQFSTAKRQKEISSLEKSLKDSPATNVSNGFTNQFTTFSFSHNKNTIQTLNRFLDTISMTTIAIDNKLIDTKAVYTLAIIGFLCAHFIIHSYRILGSILTASITLLILQYELLGYKQLRQMGSVIIRAIYYIYHSALRILCMYSAGNLLFVTSKTIENNTFKPLQTAFEPFNLTTHVQSILHLKNLPWTSYHFTAYPLILLREVLRSTATQSPSQQIAAAKEEEVRKKHFPRNTKQLIEELKGVRRMLFHLPPASFREYNRIANPATTLFPAVYSTTTTKHGFQKIQFQKPTKSKGMSLSSLKSPGRLMRWLYSIWNTIEILLHPTPGEVLRQYQQHQEQAEDEEEEEEENEDPKVFSSKSSQTERKSVFSLLHTVTKAWSAVMFEEKPTEFRSNSPSKGGKIFLKKGQKDQDMMVVPSPAVSKIIAMIYLYLVVSGVTMFVRFCMKNAIFIQAFLEYHSIFREGAALF